MSIASNRDLRVLFALAITTSAMKAQNENTMLDITQKQTYTLHRATSKEVTNGGTDYRSINPGETRVILDANGPGLISHMWFTISDPEPYHLKRLVLRIYWDGETDPSVEAPIGDFFGLGTGDYFNW